MSSLNSTAWEGCELHTTSVRTQSLRQKAEKWTTEKKQLIYTTTVGKLRLSHSPYPPNQKGPSPITSETEHGEAPGESEQMLLKLLLTLTGTETKESEHD